MDKNAVSMPTAPSVPSAQLTGTKASDTTKKVKELGDQLQEQVAQLEAATKASQEVAQRAQSELAVQQQQQQQQAIQPTMSTDDQDLKDNLMKDIKKTIGKLWGFFATDPKPDDSKENAVAGIRGAISWRDEQIKTAKKVTDKIPGGEATEIDVAKLNKEQLDMGEKVEMEHTDNPEIAREIASDHLAEEFKEGKKKDEQKYYTKLKKIHEDRCNDGVPAFWRRNLDYESH